MAQSGNDWCWQLGLASFLAINGVIANSGDCAFAQSNIVPDETLDSQYDSAQEVIYGGTIRGANLFHSFKEFNVTAGRRAYLYSPTVEIQNILVRVTGSNRSEILGLIGTYGNSNPNLFLMNPNGIIFGRNARLDVGGSFVASTASSLKFADSTEFSATAQPTTPLLTMSVPMGLQFEGNAGRIEHQSRAINRSGFGLQVQPGKTLALVGGDVKLDGGIVQVPGGQVDLGGIAGSGMVGLQVDSNNNLSLRFPVGVPLADVSLTNQALVNASGDRGGNIQVQGKRIQLTNTARIYSDTQSQNGGGIYIRAEELIVQDGSQVSASTLGAGQGGNITVHASDSVKLMGTTAINKFPSSLIAQTEGSGNAGSLTITTGKLIVQDGGQVSTGTTRNSQGNGGTLTVSASNLVKLSGAEIAPNGQVLTSGLFAQTQGSGDAGALTITTGKLIAENGAQVAVSANIGSQGNGGTLTVHASEFVELSGTAPNGDDTSGLFARGRGSGAAGNLTVSTGQLIVRDQAQLTVSGVGSGHAGDIQLTARSIQLDQKGAIVAQSASGKGGNITLQNLDLLLLRHGSQISTTAGRAQESGDGGNITINAPSGFIVAVPGENSDITANAFSGSGGRVTINATSILGIAPLSRQELEKLRPGDLDPSQLPTNDITAISQTNPSLSGNIELNTPDIDLNSGLIELPSVPIDTEVAQGCYAGGNEARSEFIITGRGGLPPNPGDVLTTDAVQVDLVTLNSSTRNRSLPPVTSKTPTTATPKRIVEATGWMINKKGEVFLTASAPTVTPHSPRFIPASCRTRRELE